MKIKGKSVGVPQSKQVVIPRGENDEDTIVFECKPVLDYTEFESRCPNPKPPMVFRPKEGTKLPDLDDKDYKKALTEHGERRVAFLMLNSINADGLEWEKAKLDDPDTWHFYREELEAHFTLAEVDLIVSGVMEANMPSEDRQKEAMQNFTQLKAVEAGPSPSSREGEHGFTQSGKPAKG